MYYYIRNPASLFFIFIEIIWLYRTVHAILFYEINKAGKSKYTAIQETYKIKLQLQVTLPLYMSIVSCTTMKEKQERKNYYCRSENIAPYLFYMLSLGVVCNWTTCALFVWERETRHNHLEVCKLSIWLWHIPHCIDYIVIAHNLI